MPYTRCGLLAGLRAASGNGGLALALGRGLSFALSQQLKINQQSYVAFKSADAFITQGFIPYLRSDCKYDVQVRDEQLPDTLYECQLWPYGSDDGGDYTLPAAGTTRGAAAAPVAGVQWRLIGLGPLKRLHNLSPGDVVVVTLTPGESRLAVRVSRVNSRISPGKGEVGSAARAAPCAAAAASDAAASEDGDGGGKGSSRCSSSDGGSSSNGSGGGGGTRRRSSSSSSSGEEFHPDQDDDEDDDEDSASSSRSSSGSDSSDASSSDSDGDGEEDEERGWGGGGRLFPAGAAGAAGAGGAAGGGRPCPPAAVLASGPPPASGADATASAGAATVVRKRRWRAPEGTPGPPPESGAAAAAADAAAVAPAVAATASPGVGRPKARQKPRRGGEATEPWIIARLAAASAAARDLFDPFFGKLLSASETSVVNVTSSMCSGYGVFAALCKRLLPVELTLMYDERCGGGGSRGNPGNGGGCVDSGAGGSGGGSGASWKVRLCVRQREPDAASAFRLTGMVSLMRYLGLSAHDVILFSPTHEPLAFAVSGWRLKGGRLEPLQAPAAAVVAAVGAVAGAVRYSGDGGSGSSSSGSGSSSSSGEDDQPLAVRMARMRAIGGSGRSGGGGGRRLRKCRGSGGGLWTPQHGRTIVIPFTSLAAEAAAAPPPPLSAPPHAAGPASETSPPPPPPTAAATTVTTSVPWQVKIKADPGHVDEDAAAAAFGIGPVLGTSGSGGKVTNAAGRPVRGCSWRPVSCMGLHTDTFSSCEPAAAAEAATAAAPTHGSVCDAVADGNGPPPPPPAGHAVMAQPASSIVHLHGHVPEGPPAACEGELRVCGLTFHTELREDVEMLMTAWMGGLRDPLARTDPVKQQMAILGVDIPLPPPAGAEAVAVAAAPPAVFRRHKLKRNVICNRLARMLGLMGEGCAGDAQLPEDSPAWVPELRRCEDVARGGFGLEASASLAANVVLGIVAGYVLPDRGCVELLNYGACRDPRVTEELRRRTGGGSSAALAAWQFLTAAFMMPYAWPSIAEHRHNHNPNQPNHHDHQHQLQRTELEAEGGGPALAVQHGSVAQQPQWKAWAAAATRKGLPAASLSMLGYGNLAALVNAPRVVNPWTLEAEGGNDDCMDGVGLGVSADAATANCVVLPIAVRGLVLPVLVTLRPIGKGEQILYDYGPEWWRQLMDPWEILDAEGLTPAQALWGLMPEVGQTAYDGSAAPLSDPETVVTDQAVAAAMVAAAVAAPKIEEPSGGGNADGTPRIASSALSVGGTALEPAPSAASRPSPSTLPLITLPSLNDSGAAAAAAMATDDEPSGRTAPGASYCRRSGGGGVAAAADADASGPLGPSRLEPSSAAAAAAPSGALSQDGSLGGDGGGANRQMAGPDRAATRKRIRDSGHRHWGSGRQDRLLSDGAWDPEPVRPPGRHVGGAGPRSPLPDVRGATGGYRGCRWAAAAAAGTEAEPEKADWRRWEAAREGGGRGRCWSSNCRHWDSSPNRDERARDDPGVWYEPRRYCDREPPMPMPMPPPSRVPRGGWSRGPEPERRPSPSLGDEPRERERGGGHRGDLLPPPLRYRGSGDGGGGSGGGGDGRPRPRKFPDGAHHGPYQVPYGPKAAGAEVAADWPRGGDGRFSDSRSPRARHHRSAVVGDGCCGGSNGGDGCGEYSNPGVKGHAGRGGGKVGDGSGGGSGGGSGDALAPGTMSAEAGASGGAAVGHSGSRTRSSTQVHKTDPATASMTVAASMDGLVRAGPYLEVLATVPRRMTWRALVPYNVTWDEPLR